LHVTTPRTVASIDEALASLPGAFAVASHHDARLVVGPAGAFVLVGVADEATVVDAASTASALAADARSALADHLSLVPFVDILLVALPGCRSGHGAATVPLHLVHDTVCEGREVIDHRSLNAIRDLLRRGLLGDWRVGLVPPADRIDLCDPNPAPTTDASSPWAAKPPPAATSAPG
jgi:hypothetical protein